MLGSPEYRRFVEKKRQEHAQLFTQSAAGQPALTNRDAAAPDVYAAIRAVQLAAQNGEVLEISAPPVASFSIIADANGVRDAEDALASPEEPQSAAEIEGPPGIDSLEAEPVSSESPAEIASTQEPTPPESVPIAQGEPAEESSAPPLLPEERGEPEQEMFEEEPSVEAQSTPSQSPVTESAPPVEDEFPLPGPQEDLPAVDTHLVSMEPVADGVDLSTQVDVGAPQAVDALDVGVADAIQPIADLAQELPASLPGLEVKVENQAPVIPASSDRAHKQASRKTTADRMTEKQRSMREGLLPRQVKGEVPIEEIENGDADDAPPPVPFLRGDNQSISSSADVRARLGDPGVNDSDGGTTPDEVEPALDWLSVAADQTSAKLGAILIEMAENLEELNDRLSAVERILQRSFGA